MTVGAPVERFEIMASTFSAMIQSFRFNERWMANYGNNPKHIEEMTPIDSRALRERHVRSQ